MVPTKPPTIAGFTPATGPAGASVTITGLNFTTATAVKFGTAVAQFTYVSDSQIVAIVPATASTGAISVTTSKGTTTSGTKLFTVIKAPTIISFSPLSGAVGTLVTVNGTNLATVTEVKFNGVSAGAPISATATSLKVNVPLGAKTGKISVTNPSSTATSTGLFKVLAKINAFTPPSALPGETITMTGINFTGVTAVKFGAVLVSPTDFTVNSDTQITAKVPLTATTGKVSLTTKDGTSTSLIDFIVIKQPNIGSISPSSGRAGTIVTITGANLSSVTEVRFNGVSAGAPTTVVSASQIKIAAPQGVTTGKITVFNRAGQATSGATFTVLQ